MKKQYKLLVETAEYPIGTEARWNSSKEMYVIFINGEEVSELYPKQIENRSIVWELIEEEKVENEYIAFMPHDLERYWYIAPGGSIEVSSNHITDIDENRIAQGVFRTEQGATYEALRRESMSKRWKPKPNEEFWEVSLYDASLSWDRFKIHQHYVAYVIGNTHKTEHDAIQWKEKYFTAWEVLL